MAWEICGAVIVAKCILVAASTVAAVGLVGYGIYRYKKYLEEQAQPQQCNKKKSESPVTSNILTIDDVKDHRSQNSNLRRRNVDQENKTKEDVDNKKNENNSIKKEQSHHVDQENKTKEDVDNKKNENNSIKKEQSHQQVKTVLEQGSQTVDFYHQSFILPTHGNGDTASVASSTTLDGTESTCDSLASTETVTSALDLDLCAGMIPTWSEMSDAERNLYLCRACEKSASTIAISCEHPYLCDECAPILIKHYSYCPTLFE